MKSPYDKYYQTENLFGKPYSELIHFFEKQSSKGKILDLGCGQGRNAIPLAEMGFEVIGIDNSKVGIQQLNEKAKKENLPLQGIVADIFKYEDYQEFDFILLDSMFHFTKNDKVRELNFLKKIFQLAKSETTIVICIQNTGSKIKILNELINNSAELQKEEDIDLKYIYVDQESNHSSTTDYKMLVLLVQ
jgi:2-polyprenyl-3-methyl-5-hydroxy-6-metoxy-1,4-benzoquinol methylase